MKISIAKTGLALVLVAGAAAFIFLQYQTRQKLRADNDSLRQQIDALKNDRQPAAAPVEKISDDDRNELLRLRGEVSALRAQTNQIARLQQQNQQLQDSVAKEQARQQSAAQILEQSAQERAYVLRLLSTAKSSVVGMILYAGDNQDQFPTNFNQASVYLSDPAVATNLDQLEIVYRGRYSNVANPATAIVVRSIQPWKSNGIWTKAYGFADGHAITHAEASGNFEEWEQQHAPMLKSQ